MDISKLRDAFGSFMTGVTVVTTVSEDGTRIGFTANSFTSVSMQPPLLLVCPGRHLNSHVVFESVNHFAISVLAEGQEAISNVFASAEQDRFDQVAWHKDRFGSPLIDGAVAHFSCSVHQRHDAGDHTILVGEIQTFESVEQRGLGYSRGGYFSLGNERKADAAVGSGKRAMACAIIEFEDSVLLCGESADLRIPGIVLSGKDGARSSLIKYFAVIGIDATVGPVYSVYDDTAKNTKMTVFRAKANSGNTARVGSYHKMSVLALADIADPAQSVMLQRFAGEHQNNEFGLYVGDEVRGEVHPQ